MFGSEGEALFNLGLLEGNFASGAYSCARCHTPQLVAHLPHLRGGRRPDHREPRGVRGGHGPIRWLRRCVPRRASATAPPSCQFPAIAGTSTSPSSPTGRRSALGYGRTGQGDGRMPGFGLRPAEDPLFWINKGEAREPGPGMLHPRPDHRHRGVRARRCSPTTPRLLPATTTRTTDDPGLPPGGDRLGPRDPQHPERRRRRRRAGRLGVPADRQQHRPAQRLPHHHGRPVRLDDHHGRRLVDLRHRHEGRRAVVEARGAQLLRAGLRRAGRRLARPGPPADRAGRPPHRPGPPRGRSRAWPSRSSRPSCSRRAPTPPPSRPASPPSPSARSSRSSPTWPSSTTRPSTAGASCRSPTASGATPPRPPTPSSAPTAAKPVRAPRRSTWSATCSRSAASRCATSDSLLGRADYKLSTIIKFRAPGPLRRGADPGRRARSMPCPARHRRRPSSTRTPR